MVVSVRWMQLQAEAGFCEGLGFRIERVRAEEEGQGLPSRRLGVDLELELRFGLVSEA